MFTSFDSGIRKAVPFVYRVDPQNYIHLTELLLHDRKFFEKIDELKNSGSNSLTYILKSYPALTKINNRDEENLFKDIDIYRYFFKEIGASLKFNPLSQRKSAIYILERICEFLYDYLELIIPGALYTRVNIKPDENGLKIIGKEIYFNSGRLKIFTNHSSLKSEKEILLKDLKDEKIVVYVVTIGAGIDNEVKSLTEKGEMFDAYLLNGIGAGAAEMVANDLNLYVNDFHGNKSFYKRLSPGYGDWPITDQEKIFALLEPEKNIGVRLTDSYIMIPEKSTSGIMGIISS